MAILTVLERQTAKFRCLYQIPCPKTLPNPNGLRRLILLPNLWYPKLLQAGHGLCNICGSVSVGCCIFPGRAGYGASGSSSGDIPGYTSLTFDVCLEGIAD